VSVITELEDLSQTGKINLYYGDESHVYFRGYVPYGWQFPGEDIYIPAEGVYRINCMGFINRKSEYMGFMPEKNIGTEIALQYQEEFSFKIWKKTVLILDNASIHKAKIIKERIPFWQTKGLFITFLLRYCPYLNLAETVWRKLKKEWLNPDDYMEKDKLFYATNRCLSNLGKVFNINFNYFSINLF
jgi:transposase